MPSPYEPLDNEQMIRSSMEGPLDQCLCVFADKNIQDTVVLDQITSEADLFEQAPVVGNLKLDKATGPVSISDSLNGHSAITSELRVISGDMQSAGFETSKGDAFAVSDTKWLKDPGELAWSSILLAQLQAKLNAISQLISEPVDLRKLPDQAMRDAVAIVAKELAEEIRDSALTELQNDISKQVERRKHAVADTKTKLSAWVVTDKEAIKAGGLTAGEVNELFPGGE